MDTPRSQGGNAGGPGASARRRGRRRRPDARRPEPRVEKAKTPVQVLEQAKRSTISEKPADEPLSEAEAAEMREHFRFLRDHRKVLHLRLNAQEDLLLNGARPPTHRGVCQHLLAKIDRARVTAAVPRLTPSEALQLTQGMLRISPDVPYVLLYLECVKASASAADATAALLRVLKKLRFAEVSAAQMRRVLDLIVELFDARELPQLMLSLLDNGAFRGAVDKSTKELPDALAEIVMPLRAAQAVVVADRRNPCSPADLRRGVQLLLQARENVLRAQPDDVRRRLFDVALQLIDAEHGDWLSALRPLLRTLPGKSRSFADAALSLAAACLRLERDNDARKLLEELARDYPDFQTPERWLSALGARRVGRVALLDRAAGERRPERNAPERVADGAQQGTPPAERLRFLNGFLLSHQLAVWVCLGRKEQQGVFEACTRALRAATIPGVARCFASGVTPEGAPYLAVSKSGRPVYELLNARAGLTSSEVRALSLGGVVLLAALSGSGLALPDVDSGRFVIESEQQVGLRDLFHARQTSVAEATSVNFELARHWLRQVQAASRYYAPPTAQAAAADSASDFATLIAVLAQPA